MFRTTVYFILNPDGWKLNPDGFKSKLLRNISYLLNDV
jgi:hypothetical protein